MWRRVVSAWFWSAQAEHPCPEKGEPSVPHTPQNSTVTATRQSQRARQPLSILGEASEALEVRSSLPVTPAHRSRSGQAKWAPGQTAFAGASRIQRAQPHSPPLETVEAALTSSMTICWNHPATSTGAL